MNKIFNLSKESTNLNLNMNYEKNRLIIEGIINDSWRDYHLDLYEQFIPQNIERLKAGYDLDLVVQVTDEGNIMEIKTSNPEKNFLELNYDYANRIQRPRTIIVDDGRIYSDLSLIKNYNNYFDYKLFHFLNEMKQTYGKNWIQNSFIIINYKNNKKNELP